MIRIVHKKEVEALIHLPFEITETMNHIATILDESYGEIRDYISDLGGYILFVVQAAIMDI